MSTHHAPPPRFVWDDELWAMVWDRHLGPVERHAIGMDVLRRRLPDELFEARVATELARQWRRRARNLIVVYALWTAFWGLLGWGAWTGRGIIEGLQLGCVLVGIAAIAGCLMMRRYLRSYAAQYP